MRGMFKLRVCVRKSARCPAFTHAQPHAEESTAVLNCAPWKQKETQTTRIHNKGRSGVCPTKNPQHVHSGHSTPLELFPLTGKNYLRIVQGTFRSLKRVNVAPLQTRATLTPPPPPSTPRCCRSAVSSINQRRRTGRPRGPTQDARWCRPDQTGAWRWEQGGRGRSPTPRRVRMSVCKPCSKTTGEIDCCGTTLRRKF